MTLGSFLIKGKGSPVLIDLYSKDEKGKVVRDIVDDVFTLQYSRWLFLPLFSIILGSLLINVGERRVTISVLVLGALVLALFFVFSITINGPRKFMRATKSLGEWIAKAPYMSEKELRQQAEEVLVELASTVLRYEGTGDYGEAQQVRNSKFLLCHRACLEFRLAERKWDCYFELAKKRLTPTLEASVPAAEPAVAV